MLNLKKHLGSGIIWVVFVTLCLFIAALFAKGFTHDLLLEAAVFLVSVKLIIMSYRNSEGVAAIQEKLDEILSEEKHLEKVLASIRKNQASDSDAGEKKNPSVE